MHHKLLLLAVLSLSVSSSQVPFSYPLDHDLFSPENAYKLEWLVEHVAVIGTGAGYVYLLPLFCHVSILKTNIYVVGLIAYRVLVKDGFDVLFFESDILPEQIDVTPKKFRWIAPIPTANITIVNYIFSLPPEGIALPYVEVQTDGA